jgi:speckle-type POZ protein
LPDVEVPKCRALEDLAYLFENSLFPDCKITSEDNKVFKVQHRIYLIVIQIKLHFKAHKCILACRSPVFAAMFQHEMIERNSNEVEIVDIKGDVIEKMLRYM